MNEELAVAEDTLYRRGNFMGTWDQIIVNALREEHDTQIAMSAGVRWGTSVLAGEMITMERVMDETSMTYGETYKSEVTGAQMKDILEGICENLSKKTHIYSQEAIWCVLVEWITPVSQMHH